MKKNQKPCKALEEYKKINSEYSQIIESYTNEEKMMLMCVASRREIIDIKHIANKIDPKSFIIITNVREVYGKGFKKA